MTTNIVGSAALTYVLSFLLSPSNPLPPSFRNQSSRAIVFDRHGNQVSMAQREFRQIFPQPGWVEHGLDLKTTDRWLAPNLGYDPEE
jgi:hypothetical protein